MTKTLLFAVICGLALTCAFAQTGAPIPTGDREAPAAAAPAPSAPQATPAASVQGAAPASPAPAAAQVLPIILIFVVFYFLLIMPQQRQRKKQTEMIAALKPGDRVVVMGGVHGIITRLKEGTMFVKIAESTEIEVDRASVSYKVGGEQPK